MPALDNLQAWDFVLPGDRIARHPTPARDASRLLYLPLDKTDCTHGEFSGLPDLLRPGDLLIVNDTRVMPARLKARRHSGGLVELLVLEFEGTLARALARPARKLKRGHVLSLQDDARATVTDEASEGVVGLQFSELAIDVMQREGSLPIPPYLGRSEEPADRLRYQTVYAGPVGAAAAPTAGLHFTTGLLERLRSAGVQTASVTLHVGLGTFRPLREEDAHRDELHAEWYSVPEATVDAIRRTRAHGGRVIAVGTTSVRALEAATPSGATLPRSGSGTTRLFLRPPARVRAVDGLITNFHLPKSSLLMLVACLCGRERLLATYQQAVQRGYRFYSYGDAMLLL
jgi:S-adenosylmethionine:tRNA ribosyltransferase-isomerase